MLQRSFQSRAGCDPIRTLTECPWSTGQGSDFVFALSLGRRDPEKPAVVSGGSDKYVASSITHIIGASLSSGGRRAVPRA